MIAIDDAIDSFLASFAYTRSIAHPADVVRAGSSRVVEDRPGRKPGPRNSEVVAYPGAPVESILADIAGHSFPGGYLASLFIAAGRDPKDVTLPMKAAGYRFLRSEPLMAIETAGVAPPMAYAVKRVQSEEDEAALRTISGRALHPGEALDPNASCRAYWIERDGKPVSWGRTVLVHDKGSYVGALNTVASYRRRGMATAVLAAMLSADHERGAEYSVLLASKAGEQVYKKFGFTTLGSLLIFSPPKSS